MKRAFDEISDDEWENHSFKPSRVLKTSTSNRHRHKSAQPPPPIESFVFKKPVDTLNSDSSSSSSGDCREITPPFNLEEEDGNLEDDDVVKDDCEEVARPAPANRGRRFVVDDDDDDDEEEEDEEEGEEDEERKEVESERDFAEVYDIESSGDDDYDGEEEEEDLKLEEDDVVGKALQKCAKISAELKRELYGSGVTSCERYAEVEASSVRIVTQVPVCY